MLTVFVFMTTILRPHAMIGLPILILAAKAGRRVLGRDAKVQGRGTANHWLSGCLRSMNMPLMLGKPDPSK